MMELFRMEAESHTATLSAGLVALEGAPAAPEAIEPLMRAAHSLKGPRGLSVSMPPSESLMQWKTASSRRRKGKLVLQPEHVDILLQGVDLLVQIAQIGEPEVEAWQSEHATAIDALVADLTAVQEGKVPPQAEASPSAAHAVGPEARLVFLLRVTLKSPLLPPCCVGEDETSTNTESARAPVCSCQIATSIKVRSGL